MQHGEAKQEQQDPERPLTERGREEVTRVAGAAARLGLGIGVILHSGKLRARQTAEIVATRLQPAPAVRVEGGLGPKDDPAEAARLVATAAEPFLLVGHLPHLSRVASLLLVGDPKREIVAFRMGGLLGFTRDQRWRLRFILTPELVGV